MTVGKINCLFDGFCQLEDSLSFSSSVERFHKKPRNYLSNGFCQLEDSLNFFFKGFKTRAAHFCMTVTCYCILNSFMVTDSAL